MPFWLTGTTNFLSDGEAEDFDSAMRLFHLGRKKLALKFAGIVFHLWHNDVHMENREKNFDYYDAQVDKKVTRCEQGLVNISMQEGKSHNTFAII